MQLYSSYHSSSATPKHLLVMLHGYGSNEDDLMSLADDFSMRLGHCELAFLSIRAPHSSSYHDGYQWFEIYKPNGEMDYDEERWEREADSADADLKACIDAKLNDLGLGHMQLTVLGFSQGGMIALNSFVKNATYEINSIICYSGMLISGHLNEPERYKSEVLFVYGDEDYVIPQMAFSKTIEALTQCNMPLTSSSIPGLGHGIDSRALELGIEFIERNFNKSK